MFEGDVDAGGNQGLETELAEACHKRWEVADWSHDQAANLDFEANARVRIVVQHCPTDVSFLRIRYVDDLRDGDLPRPSAKLPTIITPMKVHDLILIPRTTCVIQQTPKSTAKKILAPRSGKYP